MLAETVTRAPGLEDTHANSQPGSIAVTSHTAGRGFGCTRAQAHSQRPGPKRNRTLVMLAVHSCQRAMSLHTSQTIRRRIHVDAARQFHACSHLPAADFAAPLRPPSDRRPAPPAETSTRGDGMDGRKLHSPGRARTFAASPECCYRSACCGPRLLMCGIRRGVTWRYSPRGDRRCPVRHPRLHG